MDSFNIQHIEQLSNLLKPEEEEEHVYGSMLTPASIHGQSKEEVAKPNTKMQVVAGNRAEGGGAILTEEQLAELN